MEESMRTIAELFELSQRIDHHVALFGAPEEFIKAYKAKLRAVGEAMIKDYKRPPAQILEMPHTTVLGPKAQARLEDLEFWLKENMMEPAQA